jgi:hypothetical protein
MVSEGFVARMKARPKGPAKMNMVRAFEDAAELNPTGQIMTDGPTTAAHLDKIEANRALMQTCMDDLLQGRRDKFASCFDGNHYIQHNPWVADNLTGLIAGLQALAKKGQTVRARSQSARRG